MDISRSLESVEAVVETLREFPEFTSKLGPAGAFVSQHRLEEKIQNALKESEPFLSLLVAEVERELDGFDTTRVDRVSERQAFIRKRLEQRKEEAKMHREKMNIIREIEDLEKQSTHKRDEVAFSRAESVKLIRDIQENEYPEVSAGLRRLLKQRIRLEYDTVTEREEEVYRAIVALLNNL